MPSNINILNKNDKEVINGGSRSLKFAKNTYDNIIGKGKVTTGDIKKVVEESAHTTHTTSVIPTSISDGKQDNSFKVIPYNISRIISTGNDRKPIKLTEAMKEVIRSHAKGPLNIENINKGPLVENVNDGFAGKEIYNSDKSAEETTDRFRPLSSGASVNLAKFETPVNLAKFETPVISEKDKDAYDAFSDSGRELTAPLNSNLSGNSKPEGSKSPIVKEDKINAPIINVDGLGDVNPIEVKETNNDKELKEFLFDESGKEEAPNYFQEGESSFKVVDFQNKEINNFGFDISSINDDDMQKYIEKIQQDKKTYNELIAEQKRAKDDAERFEAEAKAKKIQVETMAAKVSKKQNQVLQAFKKLEEDIASNTATATNDLEKWRETGEQYRNKNMLNKNIIDEYEKKYKQLDRYFQILGLEPNDKDKKVTGKSR